MKPLRLVLAGLPMLLAACGDQPAEAPLAGPAPVAVAVAPFETLRIFPQREAPATVLGKNETRMAAEVAARILSFAVDAGDRVRKGQILVRLDSRDAELALARAEAAQAQAQARLAQAQAQAGRARGLNEKNFISAEALTLRETELLVAQADLQAASAARDTARHGVEKCTLRAPFDAVVRSRSGQVGEITAPGMPLLNLADAGELQLVAQVQARDAASLQQATTPEFVGETGHHALKMLRVSGAISREAGSVEARFAFVAAPPPPGSEGRLVWRDSRPHLPAELLVRRAGRYGIFVVAAGKAHFEPVDGAQEGRAAAVDLPATTQIVEQGRQALQDGMTVTAQAAKTGP